MSIEKKETNDEYLRNVTASLGNFNEQEKKADQADAIKEFTSTLGLCATEDEVKFTVSDVETIPTNKVMTRDADGKSLCEFGDQSWVLIDKKTGETFPINFGSNHNSRSYLDYNAPDSQAYHCLEKLATYSIWPRIDKSRRPLGAGSVKNQVSNINTFMNWLSKKNLLRSDNLETSPPDASLVTVNALKEEIEKRMKDQETATQVLTFIYGLSMWFNLGRQPYCPDWLRPTFRYRDVLNSEFRKQVATFVTAKTSRWEAIDRDILEPMFLTAKHYIDIFSEDIFWLEEQFGKAVMRHKKDTKKDTYVLTNGSLNEDLYNKVVSRGLAINPGTKNPWFEVEHTVAWRQDDPQKENYRTILKSSFNNEIAALIGAGTFIILTFTGMRHGELKRITTGALKINGKPLDLRTNAIIQVETAGENAFNISRPILKTDHYGRDHTTPIPKFAAKAFAVLVEIFRYSRKKCKGADKKNLFPSGGYVQIGGKLQDHNKDNLNRLGKYIAEFCSTAGVEYQHAHKCRKTLATLLINHDVGSLKVIQFLLGHKSIGMTMKYISSLPGVNEEILNRMWEEQEELTTEWITDVYNGTVGGAAGDRAREAAAEYLNNFEGERIPYSIKAMTQAMQEANYMILRTPAAWCMRLPSRVPHTAPCLEPEIQRAIENGELEIGTDVHINPEFCQPHLCGDAGHSSSDLKTVSRARKWAEKKVVNSGGSQAKKDAELELEYWTKVEHQITHGHASMTSINGGS